jgi:hypothetical protein
MKCSCAPNHQIRTTETQSQSKALSGPKDGNVGYLDRGTAGGITRDLVSKGIPAAAELYNLWVGDDGYIKIKIIILAPPGYGMKARLRGHS